MQNPSYGWSSRWARTNFYHLRVRKHKAWYTSLFGSVLAGVWPPWWPIIERAASGLAVQCCSHWAIVVWNSQLHDMPQKVRIKSKHMKFHDVKLNLSMHFFFHFDSKNTNFKKGLKQSETSAALNSASVSQKQKACHIVLLPHVSIRPIAEKTSHTSFPTLHSRRLSGKMKLGLLCTFHTYTANTLAHSWTWNRKTWFNTNISYVL